MAPIAKPVSSVLVEGSFLKRWGARLVPFAATATPIVVMERQLSMWSMNPIGLTDALAGGSAAAALGLLVTGLVVSAAKSSLRKFENAGLQAEIGGMQAQLGELSGQLKELDAANDEKIKRLGEKDRTIAELNDALKQAKSAGIEEIGSGAMGKVVKYFDLAEKSFVAKKTLHIALCQHPEIIARFQKEMDTLKSLNSPNVIRIIGTGMENGIPYFIMEHIEGNTLSHFIGWRGLGDDVDRTLPIFEQIANGVEAVHAKDLIHRDIKPDNIMMANDGRIVLLDLGIIKDLNEGKSAGLTQSGGILGTLAYMAPEQLLGQEISQKSDIYSLGATYYHLITGRVPFTFTNLGDFVAEVSTRKPDLNLIPKELRLLIGKMLENNPKERPTIQMVQTALQRIKMKRQTAPVEPPILDLTQDAEG